MLGEKKQLPVRRELYTDPAFPASDTSIFFDSCTPLAQFRGEISWLRPQVSSEVQKPVLVAGMPR